jgi:preprotein translocase subunit SecB
MGEIKPDLQNAIRMLHFRILSVDFDCAKALGKDFLDSFDTDLDFSLGFDDKENRHYTVQFNLSIENAEYDFKLEVLAVAIFSAIEEISEKDKESFLFQQNSPAIAFPFLRSFIGTFTANCGLPTIVLPTYNFAK